MAKQNPEANPDRAKITRNVYLQSALTDLDELLAIDLRDKEQEKDLKRIREKIVAAMNA